VKPGIIVFIAGTIRESKNKA